MVTDVAAVYLEYRARGWRADEALRVLETAVGHALVCRRKEEG